MPSVTIFPFSMSGIWLIERFFIFSSSLRYAWPNIHLFLCGAEPAAIFSSQDYDTNRGFRHAAEVHNLFFPIP